jgi:hypothetical protein
MRNNEELKRSHANGFGGSDAKMFAKIGTKGIESLSTTEKKRILVALGKMEAEDFGGNVYTEAGHLFEEWCETNGITAGCEREKYLERKGMAVNFKTFAHADFYDEAFDTDKVKQHSVYECKYSQDPTDKVHDDYYEQLQWYYLMGATRVVLIHGWGNVLPFKPSDYCAIEIERDNTFLEWLAEGIRILDEAVTQGMFEDINATTVDVVEMDGDAAIACQRLGLVMAQIKEAEKLADDYKQVLHDWMERNGVLNIKGDGFMVSYVSPTTRKTFDTKKAQADFPALKDDQYYKTSAVKSSVKITLKQ